MTGYDEVTYMPRARKSGADAFVEKSQTMPFFVQVIRDVIEGKQYFPQQKTIPVQPGEAPLTERELETLRLICEGVSRKEIAERMGISENTLYRHIQSVTGKWALSAPASLWPTLFSTAGLTQGIDTSINYKTQYKITVSCDVRRFR